MSEPKTASLVACLVLTPIKIERTRHRANSVIELDDAFAADLIQLGYVVAHPTPRERSTDDDVTKDGEAKAPVTQTAPRDRMAGANVSPAPTPATPTKTAAPRKKAKV